MGEGNGCMPMLKLLKVKLSFELKDLKLVC